VTCYAIANVKSVEFCPDIAEYLSRIDATLDQHGGRFLVHGGPVTHMEGNWIGQLILIEFPDRDSLLAWYNSPEYQTILPLRTRHMRADIIIADGLPAGYRATDQLATLRAAGQDSSQ
jgi:uncharacterized protein (DUF1330 family)